MVVRHPQRTPKGAERPRPAVKHIGGPRAENRRDASEFGWLLAPSVREQMRPSDPTRLR
jgi:hypothetical protein